MLFDEGKDYQYKTSILVNLPNKAGVLYRFLKKFNKAQIDLTKIKSHIAGGITTFFIEFNGHQKSSHIENIMQKYKENVIVLGSFLSEEVDV